MLKIPRFMSEYASYLLKAARSEKDPQKKSLIEICTRRALSRYECGLQSINETMQVLCNIGRSLSC